jgi:hypothetical protein
MKLTGIDYAPYVNLNSLIHVVNTGDTTQSQQGSSYKVALSDLSNLFGGSYWSASTGTNAIVLSNSGSLASGINSVAEGLNTTAAGYTSRASGYNSKALGITSFVHSSNSAAVGNRSVVLGGQSITGTTADTVYVPNLNINIAPPVNNTLSSVLARNTNGNVVQRQISGYGLFNWETKTNIGGIVYNASSNTGYISNNGHPSNPSEYLLPTTASTGDVVKVMVLDGKAALAVSSPQSIVYGTGDNDTGGSFTAPLAFNFGKYESAEATYLGSNKWVISSFMTTEDLSGNPLINRIY